VIGWEGREGRGDGGWGMGLGLGIWGWHIGCDEEQRRGGFVLRGGRRVRGEGKKGGVTCQG
jgi:hypothetical protein